MEQIENTELRHASSFQLIEVARILEEEESWKKLMANIPLDLTDDNNFKSKYTNEDIKLVENESLKQRRSCAEILFEEWGTSGRIRPTLAYLLKLLMKSELYRAADVISNMLTGNPVKRPLTGPAAAVDVSLSHLLAEKNINNKDMERFLNKMEYPESMQSIKTIDNNLNYNVVKQKVQTTNQKVPSAASSLSDNGESALTNSTLLKSSVSDMIKFSTGTVSNNSTSIGYIESDLDRPAISALLNRNSTSFNTANVTNESVNIQAINSNVSFENSDINVVSDQNIPDFDRINSGGIPKIPNISILNNSGYISDGYTSSESNIPMLSAIGIFLSPNIQVSNNISISSLSTTIPHFNYSQLEIATNQFDERTYKNGSSESGCKLGSGGTGTVFLAKGIFDYPIAVKKLSVGAGNYSEEILSKQFKREVELLSKYKHDNLLLLLGYSFDGPNNCLIYEYLEGGSLQDNIVESQDLDSIVRMNIALGTAEGIQYLHYGFEKSLIHRDIKSANILLTKDKKPKVCDFGLVKLLSDQSLTSKIIGTSAYMAPEAFRGDVDVKIDVYSYGVVLLELLTGLPPLDNNRVDNDIVTYVEETCNDRSINEFVDTRAGQWDCAEELFKLSKKCLEQKSKRLNISEVVERLRIMMKN